MEMHISRWTLLFAILIAAVILTGYWYWAWLELRDGALIRFASHLIMGPWLALCVWVFMTSEFHQDAGSVERLLRINLERD